MGIYFVSFFVLGVFAMSYPDSLEQDCQPGSQALKDSEYQKAFIAANKTLCKDDCVCYFPQFQRYTIEDQKRIEKMGATSRQDTHNQSSMPIVNAQNCGNWSNNTYPATAQLAMIETFFNCAGWCHVNQQFNLYYLFSNVNNGIPESSCVLALINFFQSFGSVIKVSSFFVCTILFLILCTIFCLCCHPERSREYDAMQFFKETLIQSKSQLNQEHSQLKVNLDTFSSRDQKNSNNTDGNDAQKQNQNHGNQSSIDSSCINKTITDQGSNKKQSLLK